MMINFKTTALNMEMTDAIEEYAKGKFSFVENFTRDGNVAEIHIELSKTTNHHKHGDFYRCEVDVNSNGKKYRAVSEQEDSYAAIDDARDEINRTMTSSKDKNRTLFRRGASSIKKMMKGLSKRNPFTSKY